MAVQLEELAFNEVTVLVLTGKVYDWRNAQVLDLSSQCRGREGRVTSSIVRYGEGREYPVTGSLLCEFQYLVKCPSTGCPCWDEFKRIGKGHLVLSCLLSPILMVILSLSKYSKRGMRYFLESPPVSSLNSGTEISPCLFKKATRSSCSPSSTSL